MKKSIIIALAVGFAVLAIGFFMSCENLIYTSGLSQIEFNGKEYVIDYSHSWKMDDVKYEENKITQNGHKISIRTFSDDKDKQFIFCVDNSTYYYDESKDLPENTKDNIKSLFFLSDYRSTSDKKDIEAFVKVLSEKPRYGISTRGSFCTVRISYMNSPVVNYYGNIEVDNNGNYWLCHCETIKKEDDLEIIDEFYPISNNSPLLSYC